MPAKDLCRHAPEQWDAGFRQLDNLRASRREYHRKSLSLRRQCHSCQEDYLGPSKFFLTPFLTGCGEFDFCPAICYACYAERANFTG